MKIPGRKLISALLAVVIVLSLCVTAFAEEDDSPAADSTIITDPTKEPTAEPSVPNEGQEPAAVFTARLSSPRTANVVSPDMDAAAIQQIVTDNAAVAFEAGTYTGVNLTVSGEKVFTLNGDVILTGSGSNSPAITLQDASLQIVNGNADTGSSLTITDYTGGILAQGTGNSLIIPDTSVSIDQNRGTGINFIGEFNLRVGGETYSGGDGTRITKETAESKTYVAELSITRSGYTGMQNVDADGGERYFKLNAVFNDSRVNISNNGFSGYYTGNFNGMAAFTLHNSYFSANGNGGTGIAFQWIDLEDVTTNNHFDAYDSYVTFTDNAVQGINGDSQIYVNSTVDASGNKGATCLGASRIQADNSAIRIIGSDSPSNRGLYSAFYLTGEPIEANTSVLKNCDVQIENVEFGMYLDDYVNDDVVDEDGNYAGGMSLRFENTRVSLDNNTGIDLFLARMGDFEVVDGSSFTMSCSGNYGVAVNTGKIKVTDSSFVIKELSGIKPGLLGYFFGENNAQDIHIGKNTLSVLGKNAISMAFGHPTYHLYVTGGSFEAPANYMRLNGYGDAVFTLNGVVPDGASYSAPINENRTMLTRFDLEGVDAQSFTAYDPNGEDYTYEYRFDENGKAYVWTPVSIVHYDATQGVVIDEDRGTSQKGFVLLRATRGDRTSLKNTADETKADDRYATDYTIFGNSLALSRGQQPSAALDGKFFSGWYVRVVDGRLDTTWMDQCTDSDGSVDWEKFYDGLNTKVTDETDLITLSRDHKEDLTDVTLYAKWVGFGNLTISKTVSGNASDVNDEFSFTLTLIDLPLNGTYGDLEFENGIATFTLKHGQSVTATGLPAGTSYEIVEVDSKGYIVTSTDPRGSIPVNDTAESAFHGVKEKEPEPTETTPTVPETTETTPTETTPSTPPTNSPSTGDTASVRLWQGLMILALIGLVVVFTALNKRKGQAR